MEFLDYMIFICAAFVIMSIGIAIPAFIFETFGLSDKIEKLISKLFSLEIINN